jgi:hypothetical protein
MVGNPAYTRKWRARQRAGRILLQLEIDETDLVISLVDRGLLDPLQADNKRAIRSAAEQALRAWCSNGVGGDAMHDKIKVALLLATLRKRVRVRSRRLSDRTARSARATALSVRTRNP